MGLLLFLDVVCFDDRCFIKFGGRYRVRRRLRWDRCRSLHGSISRSISTTARGSCIVDDMWRRGYMAVKLINCNDDEDGVVSFAIFAYMMCMLFDADAR